MVNLFSSGKLDKCQVTISYRKYTWISKNINRFCTCLSPSWPWCGCLHVSSFRNGSWWKKRKMGPKVKQITYGIKQTSANWFYHLKTGRSRKEGLTSISSRPLCILQKILIYFNLCWWLCNSTTQKKTIT